MTETLTGKVVALRAPVSTAHGNDPHGSLDIWEAYVAADRPLLPRTQYSAQLEGTNDGRVFSRNFTFTTGN